MTLMMPRHVEKYLQFCCCEETSQFIFSLTPFKHLAKVLISYFTVF